MQMLRREMRVAPHGLGHRPEFAAGGAWAHTRVDFLGRKTTADGELPPAFSWRKESILAGAVQSLPFLVGDVVAALQRSYFRQYRRVAFSW
jgi:hypothetical protein